MKKLTLLCVAVSLVAGSSVALAQGPASEAKTTNSYSPPKEEHHKKPKKNKKAASATMEAPAGASQ
jgi:hypothetical protein